MTEIYAGVGIGFILMGLFTFYRIVLFYVGRRRDFYFIEWRTNLPLSSGLTLVGLLILSVVVIEHWPVTIFLSIVAGSSGLLLTIWMMNKVKGGFAPVWVQEFEYQRPPDDVEAVVAYGTHLLMVAPRHFRSVVNQQVGWDTWLLTVTNPLPLPVAVEEVHRLIALAELHAAFRLADALVEQHPRQPDAYCIRAESLLALEQFEAARQDIMRTLTLQPMHSRALQIKRNFQWKS
jgi:hypothetical protein